MSPRVERGAARRRLLDAAVDVIRHQGLHATSVDDLCAAAGVTKGAFFHHFESKEALAVAAAEHWSTTTAAMFAAADYHDQPTAAERVLSYLDLRAALIRGEPAQFSCLAGTMTQEAFESSVAVRDAAGAAIFDHAATLEADIAEALAATGNPHAIDPADLARHTQAAIQGGFILAKAANDAQMARDTIVHLRRYCEYLFSPPTNTRPTNRGQQP